MLFESVDKALNEGNINEAIQLRPQLLEAIRNPSASYLLGRIHSQAGDPIGALAFLGEALRIDPTTIGAYRLRARVFEALGEHGQAARDIAATFIHGIADPAELKSYAEHIITAQLYEEGAEVCVNLAKRAPNNAFTLNAAGAMLQLAERCDEALSYHLKAFALDPNNADYANNLGTAYRHLRQYAESTHYLELATKLDPLHHMAWYNLGNIYRNTRRYELGEQAYRRSIALKPDYPESHFTLACSLLQRGEWIEGWKEFEWRWKSPRIVPPLTIDLPLWDGKNARGKRIIVVSEQGSGDTIQCVRHLKQLADLGATVTVWAPPETAKLIRRLPFLAGVATLRRDMPPAEVYIPMMSLPRIMKTTPENLPPPPYLHYDQKLAKKFAQKLGPRRERLRLGIAWAGNPAQGDNDLRSAKLTRLAALFADKDIRWISVQKGGPESQIHESGLPLEDWGAELDSFDTTAALFATLDGVVSVCTGPAHLAGALNIQTACMLSWSADWRWGLDPSKTALYPSLTLLRQNQFNDWEDVAARTAEFIRSWRPAALVS